MQIGARKLGNGHPCFITFEAGATHAGLEEAKLLCRHAAEAGADAVKFQILDPDRLVADRQVRFTYEILVDRATGKTEKVSEPLYDILCRRSMERSQWKELKRFADSLHLAFFATVGFEDEVELLEELGCDSVKIASADVNHWPLLRRVAKTRMSIQLDTGNATLGEVEEAFDLLRSEGCKDIIIHNCPSGYPARLESINLRLISTLKRMFDCPVAFSDHSPGMEMDIAAVALGANLVEKTITLDRTTSSVEHIFSLEPSDMGRFVKTIREVETALGAGRRILLPEERERGLRIRRSVFLAEAVKAGTKAGEARVEYRRPGYGIAPNQFERLAEFRFKRDLPAGHRIGWGDLRE